MAHEDFKELLVPHALTALDRDDVRALESHLATCSECRVELDGWRDTAAALALAASPVEPSPHLRVRILESARAEGENLRQTADRTDRRSVTASKVIRLPQTPKRRWTSIQGWGAIAAVLAFVTLLAALVVLWRQNNSAKTELARLSDQVEAARQELSREREAVGLLTTPGARLAELAGTVVAPGAHAMLAYNGKTGHAILIAKGLPQAPAGKAYQLWFIAGGHPLPGVTFTLDSSGNATVHDQVPAEALNTAVFAITLEPAGGLQAPTGQMYLKSSS